jgi:hypothetical protein
LDVKHASVFGSDAGRADVGSGSVSAFGSDVIIEVTKTEKEERKEARIAAKIIAKEEKASVSLSTEAEEGEEQSGSESEEEEKGEPT